MKDIFAAAKTPIAWESVDVTPIIKDGKTAIPDAAIENIKKNKVALKGPLAVRAPLRLPLCTAPPRDTTTRTDIMSRPPSARATCR